ncbi:MAG: HAD-IA family hydrolase, partial [Candidatus Paceibacterota bacterium]
RLRLPKRVTAGKTRSVRIFMIKAVIFDFDDTLVETIVAKWAQHKHVAKKFYNVDVTDDLLRLHWGKPLDKLIGEICNYSDTKENMIEAYNSTRNDFPKNPYPGSVKVTRCLIDKGFKVGVLSATTKRFLVEDLENYGFPTEEFICIQGAEETTVHKPHPDVFLPLLKKLEEEGIKKDEIVYIGDSLDDFRAARGAGINFIAVTTGLYSKKDFKKNGAKNITKEIREVIDFLSD